MSRLPFELLLALRYLRPKRTFVSAITLISIVGVMLGVAVLIIVISVMTGFDRQLRDRLLGFTAHLTITAENPMANHSEILAEVARNRLVRGVAPFVIGPTLAQTQPAGGSPRVLTPWVRGVDPKLEPRVSSLLTNIVEGTNDLRGNGILVGRAFALSMKVRVGDMLAVYSMRDYRRIDEIVRKIREGREVKDVPLPAEFEVRGIFELGYYEFDNAFILTSLANAQDLFDLGDSVGGLLVMLHDAAQANQVRNELERTLGGHFAITTWEEGSSQALLQALVVEKNVMFYLLFFIMIVAAFGITSALITFVVQKTREIGILKALGASGGQIVWIFLGQSLIVGVWGVLAGCGLGMLAVHYRNEFLFLMRRVTGWELFPAQIYSFTELPALVVRSDVALICGGSLFICLLAGLLPAWSAGKLKPVEALRHE